MLKKNIVKGHFVSLFHSLNNKGKRYYWTPINSSEYNKNYLIEQKCNISQEFKKTQELIKIQESSIKKIDDKLSNQERVIEKLNNNVSIVVNATYAFIASSLIFITLPAMLMG